MGGILSLFQDFDVANFLPEPNAYLIMLAWSVRLGILIVPLVLLGLGAWYYFFPPKEANHAVGFRSYWAMGSVQAWQYAQRLAGVSYLGLGGVLFVISAVVCVFVNGQRAMGMINVALVCGLIQLVLVLAIWITLNVLIYQAYDKDGNPKK